MSRRFRFWLAVVAGVVLVFALGFMLQASWATMFWPVPAGRLSHIFVSSILAAIGIPALWIALSNERRALAAGAIDLGITNAGIAVAGLWFFWTTGNVGMLLLGLTTAVLFLLCIWLSFYGHGAPFLDRRPMPLIVRIAFAVFALLLGLTSTALLFVRPNTFPWPLSAENSVIYAFIFYGAMAYFLYGLVYPVWGNARGQLLGFLAYDAILIPPFISHFATVQPAMRASLIVYTSVLVLSSLLAAYFLFMDSKTRFGARSG